MLPTTATLMMRFFFLTLTFTTGFEVEVVAGLGAGVAAVLGLGAGAGVAFIVAGITVRVACTEFDCPYFQAGVWVAITVVVPTLTPTIALFTTFAIAGSVTV